MFTCVTLWIYDWQNQRQGIQFDIPYVIQRLKMCFGDVVVNPTDYYEQRIIFFEKRPNEAGSKRAKQIAKRDANEMGPGYRFVIDSIGATGCVERFKINFRTELGWTDAQQKQIEYFLNSFGLNKLQWTTKGNES
jgi:hypothetical protein